MAFILDKKEERDLKVLTLLYSDERWWTTEELAKEVNCSFETILKSVETLTFIADKLENVYTITSQKNRGIMLIAESSCSFVRLESLYYRQTSNFLIIDAIFQNNDLTIDQLSDLLYISKSTLYRKLKRIAILFSRNNLTLDKNTLTINGPEMYIREFFYIFYWSIIHTETWPFKNVSQELIMYRINDFIAQDYLEISAIEKIQLGYRMAINFIRHQNKFFITELPTDILVDSTREAYLLKVSSFFTTHIPTSSQELETKYLALIFITYPYLREYPGLEDFSPIVNWYKESHSLTYEVTSLLIDQLCDIYPHPTLTKQLRAPRVIFLLFSVANYALLFPKIRLHERLATSWIKQLVELEKITPTFYHHLKESVLNIYNSKTYHHYLMPPLYGFYSAYAIFNYCLDLSLFEKAISVKLISAFNQVGEDSLSAQLHNQINQKLLITTSHLRNDQDKTYDLLLCDVNLPEDELPLAKKTYIWDYPPSERDWRNIRQLLQDLQTEKN